MLFLNCDSLRKLHDIVLCSIPDSPDQNAVIGNQYVYLYINSFKNISTKLNVSQIQCKFSQLFIDKTFPKLKTNIRNEFPIEFCIDIGLAGSHDEENSSKTVKCQFSYNVMIQKCRLKKTLLVVYVCFLRVIWSVAGEN